MIICPSCRSDNVDAGPLPPWPGMGLYALPGIWISIALVWLGMFLLDRRLYFLGVPPLLIGIGWSLYLTVRHIARFGMFGAGVYRPTPCHCRHCGHDWVQLPPE